MTFFPRLIFAVVAATAAFIATAAARPAAPRALETPASAAGDTLRLSSNRVLSLLPDGLEKRRLLLDCTGCHTMDVAVVYPGGRARTAEEWAGIVERMLRMAGATTPFPVISADRDAASTGEWLAAHWDSAAYERLRGLGEAAPGSGSGSGFEVTEFQYPVPRDLPHDVAVEDDGRVVVTGMFTDAMRRLDPVDGTWEDFPIPVKRANPRALELDRNGDWWVLLGAARRIARYSPATASWSSWEVPFYGHSIRTAPDGRVWVNGHFTRNPIQVAALDPGAGALTLFEIPGDSATRSGAGPIPYGLRVAEDGSVWGTELQGGRLFRLDPATAAVDVWPLPVEKAGPRRPALDAAGAIWIPEYANNRLTRFDPVRERFASWTLPVPDALPYVVVTDTARGRVWVGTGAADAVFLFDPRAESWTRIPLPSTGALVRHMALDGRSGDVWVAYGASPGIPATIARVRGRTPGR